MNNNTNILIVDDDDAHRTMLVTLLEGWGYAVAEADDGSTAVDQVKKRAFDLVLMDNRMLKVSGMEALVQIKSINAAIPVIIMTAYSTIELSVAAIKKGAYDYLTKPLDFDKLKLIIPRAMEHVQLREENRQLKMRIGEHFDSRNIIGSSPRMVNLLETIAQVAPTEATVLISGESGTGKELVASAVHFNSDRKDKPLVKINCAAITETLLESELFGHEKGAFTGADRKKDGRFLQADGGTIFLDEIGEMPFAMQAKLLRVLQEKELTRVGGEKVITVDVRVITATNKILQEQVQQGVFREDLYYRLNVVALEIPPLRSRRDDIPLLTQAFLEKFTAKNNKSIEGFTPAAMNYLMNYDWPGNIRELMNTIERGVILSRNDFLDIEDFSMLNVGVSQSSQAALEPSGPVEILPLEEVEKNAILLALDLTGNNKSETARKLGITRRTLHQKLKRYGMM
ncbi:MAG: sigma-54-dependent Fis family transcriptional regulator [Deltaproteobacteria bacterium]|nr:sigma-54-dependent Fis family transcriptional regulator [Deltaproteobacteria bacterium]